MAEPTTLPIPAPDRAEKPGLLLTQRESWEYLGLPRPTWYRLRAAGKLPEPVNVPGGDLYWRRSDLDQWAAKLKPARGPRRAPKSPPRKG